MSGLVTNPSTIMRGEKNGNRDDEKATSGSGPTTRSRAKKRARDDDSQNSTKVTKEETERPSFSSDSGGDDSSGSESDSEFVPGTESESEDFEESEDSEELEDQQPLSKKRRLIYTGSETPEKDLSFHNLQSRGKRVKPMSIDNDDPDIVTMSDEEDQEKVEDVEEAKQVQEDIESHRHNLARKWLAEHPKDDSEGEHQSDEEDVEDIEESSGEEEEVEDDEDDEEEVEDDEDDEEEEKNRKAQEELDELLDSIAKDLGQKMYDEICKAADEGAQEEADEQKQAAMIMMGMQPNPYAMDDGCDHPPGLRIIQIGAKRKEDEDKDKKNDGPDKKRQKKDDKSKDKKWDTKGKPYNLRSEKHRIRDFRDTLSPEKLEKLEKAEKEIWEMNKHEVPPRYKILLSDMSTRSKAKVISYMDRLANMGPLSSEYGKLIQWVDGVMAIPFGKVVDLPVSLSSTDDDIKNYINTAQHVMDECIYGQKQAKGSILECLGQWITNPKSTNRPIAFIGDKGTGKTTLAKEGIAKALGRPFCMISLGGESDAASFKGHDYTYEGARWGRIVDMLMSVNCMNPVIFFDELDKLSETRHGEEIAGMLIHLTDTTQNDCFADKYFAGIDIDLSRALFIFSYNDEHRVHPILKDRLTQIRFDPFKVNDKVQIAKKFLIPRACMNIGLRANRFHIPDETIENLISHFVPAEAGVRGIKKVLETLLLRLNLVQLPHTLEVSYRDIKPKKNESGSLVITPEIAFKLLNGFMDCEQMSASARMMYL